MKEVKHRSHGQPKTRLPAELLTDDVALDPGAQPMLYRLGMNISDFRAPSVDRVQLVKQIAAVIRARSRA